jgi:hypothetical protein
MIFILVIHLDRFPHRRPEPQRKVESLPIVSNCIVKEKRKEFVRFRPTVFEMLCQQYHLNKILMASLCSGLNSHHQFQILLRIIE